MTAVAYSYGTWRSHAKGSITWADLQPTQGSYAGTGSDQAAMVLNWTTFDSIMAEADSVGVGICWNMYRTPPWASIPGDQVGGSNTVVGAWGDAGESAVPAKLQYLTDIVTKVLQRANAGRKRIIYVEPLNEPEFYDSTALAAYIAASGKPFWTGTPSQAVDYVWTVRQAVKAFDSTIPVLMPGQYSTPRIDSFLTATGSASSKKGWETFDYLNIHPYTAAPNQALGGNDLYYVTGVTAGIAVAQRSLAAAGCPTTKLVAATEWGLSTTPNSVVTAFNTGTSASRFTYLTRLFAMAALDGIPLFIPFTYLASPASNSLAGDFTNDTAGCIAAMTDVNTKLAGKTIVSGGYYPDGSVTVQLLGGSVYTW